MKTFIWADAYGLSFSEYEFFVAVANSVDEARELIVEELKIREKSEIDKTKQEFIPRIKKNHLKIIEEINKRDPSHIISAGMAMIIPHANE